MSFSTPDGQQRLGVLAFGDSITHGGGERHGGVATQSWALWLARGLGVPYSGFAIDGATVDDVVKSQIPSFEAGFAHPEARFDVGCLYIGVNDVRGLDWDASRFERSFAAAMSFLRGRCDRLLTMTVPLDLGRPRADARRVGECNAAIERVAADAGALVVQLSSLRARNLLMADHIHPTAVGQVALAERALAELQADGAAVAVHPSTLISFATTRTQRLRADALYVYRHVSARAISLCASARARAPTPERSR